MKMSEGVLTIFPTELAKRRAERRLVLNAGVLDTSRITTQSHLMKICETAARRAGLLKGRTPGTAEQSLLFAQAAETACLASDQPLARLSADAKADLLKQLIENFSFLAKDESTLPEWLTAHEPTHKLHGLGQLLNAWRTVCIKTNTADRFTVNAALLQLIESGDLPNELKDGIIFRAVRWFNPFEEQFAAALKTRLGSDKVQVVSVLPAAHAEVAEDRLGAVVRSELEHGNEEEWKPWIEDFADAFEADDSNILEAGFNERVSFFTAANPYGEIEDAARRIATKIEGGTAPDEIALILRNLSPYTDIIPDVFQRFGIPYYFRRGIPAAAHPPVKSLLALLDLFSGFPSGVSRPYIPRDRLCDLLLNPSIDWPGVEDCEALAQELRKKEPPRLLRLPEKLKEFFQYLEKDYFSERAGNLIQRHNLQMPEEVLNLINELNQVALRPLDSRRMIPLFEKLLDNITLKNEHPLSTESGVWIINPMDAAGLRFESVYLAGMDDRTFPQIPKMDPLLSTIERNALRAFLTERKIFCPRLALSETGEALIQEEILFLTAVSAARKQLTLSYTRADADGKECSPGEFFERMRGLANIDKPVLGESFHTILPPDAIRAQDEVRQTSAFQCRTPITPSPFPAQRVKNMIFQWLENHPEFSATALESLARNRYVFFLEKVLGIKPDRTHEDDPDPMDRGILIHDILELVYTSIAEQSGLYAVPNVDAVFAGVIACAPRSQPQENAGGTPRLRWRVSQQKTENSIPLAVFDPAKADELLTLARNIADEEFMKAERRPGRHLGHHAVWETEKRKLHQVIENFIRMDIETAQAENRYPTLFEMKFDEKHDLPVILRNPNCRAEMVEDLPAAAGRPSTIPLAITPAKLQNQEIRLKGKIDRIDLIFDDDGELEKLLVVDYKGKSRNDSIDTLEKKIGLNLDCQLALYTFAAQQKFFGEHNTPELNEKVQAVYHLQERDLKKMTNHFEKKRLTMTPELTNAFLETLFSNVWKFLNGDLATKPLIAGFEDYSHICRTTALDPKEMLK